MSLLLLFNGVGGGAPITRQVLITGQSNANGSNVGALWGTTDPAVLMFNGGPRPGGSGQAASLVSLTPFVTSAGGAQSGGETCGFGLGYQLAALTGDQVLVSVAALDASRCNQRNQTGEATFDNLVYQRQRGLALGASGPLAVVMIDGETDTEFNNLDYGTDQIAFHDNLEAALGESVYVYYIQQVVYGTAASGTNGSWSTARMMDEVAEALPARRQVVAAVYDADGDASGEPIHRANSSQRLEGGKVGAAIYRHLVLGETRANVRMIPGEVTLAGATITANFHVPAGRSLAFDYALVGKNSTAGNIRGVSYFDDAGTPVTVTGVSITGGAQIQVTLSGAPTGTAGSRRLRIGWGTSSGNRWNGSGRTNLCAPSVLLGPDGAALVDFATIQSEAVT
jgi:hypothetical protein